MRQVFALMAFVGLSFAQGNVKPVNDLPNPYVTNRDWAKPPSGQWAAVTAVEGTADGGNRTGDGRSVVQQAPCCRYS